MILSLCGYVKKRGSKHSSVSYVPQEQGLQKSAMMTIRQIHCQNICFKFHEILLGNQQILVKLPQVLSAGRFPLLSQQRKKGNKTFFWHLNLSRLIAFLRRLAAFPTQFPAFFYPVVLFPLAFF